VPKATSQSGRAEGHNPAGLNSHKILPERITIAPPFPKESEIWQKAKPLAAATGPAGKGTGLITLKRFTKKIPPFCPAITPPAAAPISRQSPDAARRRQTRPGKGAQTKQGNPLQEGSNKYRAKQKKHKPKNA